MGSLPFVVASIQLINEEYVLAGLIYVSFHVLVLIVLAIYIYGNWAYILPQRKPILANEPAVAVIIPTVSEPVYMLAETIKSVINQDYPRDKLTIVLGDDGNRNEMRSLLETMSQSYPAVRFIYHVPPSHIDSRRKGAAKAGNLNSCFELLTQVAPEIEYIETRDADDLVPYRLFMREMVGQLVGDKNIAFVQAAKLGSYGQPDPFNNNEDLFYQVLMVSRNASRSVFPCGSALVWRASALSQIGGFPTWNLLEDFQSGVEAARAGLKGLYLPVYGALSQQPPEDIPNMYKQRGTWAIDSIRFLIWGNKRGLTLGQILGFCEPGILYVFSGIQYVFAIFSLYLLIFDIPFLVTSPGVNYYVYYFTFTVSGFVFVLNLANRSKVNVSNVLKNAQVFCGLGPIYLYSLVVAFLYGPNRKPRYFVTRKVVVPGIYIFQVLPQLGVVVLSAIGIVSELEGFIDKSLPINWLQLGWAMFFIWIYSRIIWLAGYNVKRPA